MCISRVPTIIFRFVCQWLLLLRFRHRLYFDSSAQRKVIICSAFCFYGTRVYHFSHSAMPFFNALCLSRLCLTHAHFGFRNFLLLLCIFFCLLLLLALILLYRFVCVWIFSAFLSVYFFSLHRSVATAHTSIPIIGRLKIARCAVRSWYLARCA